MTRDLFALRTDNDVAQLAAVRAGFGIGVCQLQVGRREGLVHDPARPVQLQAGYLDLHARDPARKSQRMRLMFDHLAKSLGEYANEAKA